MQASIRDTIDEIGVDALVAVGFRRRTIYRWRSDDCIPGEGASHEWRRKQFEDAVKKIRSASKATPKPKNERAA